MPAPVLDWLAVSGWATRPGQSLHARSAHACRFRPPSRIAGRAAASRPGDPRWRILLESRWRARLLEVTELSLAYHDAAAAPVLSTGPADGGPAGGRRLRRLLNRAVGARRALADTEEALVRLAAGQFGRCEYCAAPIPATQLAMEPETRYCPRCQPAAAWIAPPRPGADRP